jgi:hypothetical protein
MADVTRAIHRELTDRERSDVLRVKAAGEVFLAALDQVQPEGRNQREIALARTKVEEAVMWAVKGITG